jgi:ketosteroid isomerase-like protein
MAQNRDEIETRNKAVVRAGLDAWSSSTGSPYDLLADDASWTIVQRPHEGRPEADHSQSLRRRGHGHRLLRRQRHGARRQTPR